MTGVTLTGPENAGVAAAEGGGTAAAGGVSVTGLALTATGVTLIATGNSTLVETGVVDQPNCRLLLLNVCLPCV